MRVIPGSLGYSPEILAEMSSSEMLSSIIPAFVAKYDTTKLWGRGRISGTGSFKIIVLKRGGGGDLKDTNLFVVVDLSLCSESSEK